MAADKVSVTIWWTEPKWGEWTHSVTPETADAMQKQVDTGDEWLIWDTEKRFRSSSYSNATYITEAYRHRVRMAEVRGLSVQIREK